LHLTYRTWRRGRYERLRLWEIIKGGLCLMLALLKPTVKIAKVILVSALFKLVKVAKSVVVVVVVIRVWRVSAKCVIIWLR